MLCEVCMWIACSQPGVILSPLMWGFPAHGLLSSGLFQILRAGIIPVCFREREHQWRISVGETMQIYRMRKWTRHPLWKSQKAVCGDYGTILKRGEPGFRSSWLEENMPYGLVPRKFELSFSSYKMKMASYPACVSRDWLRKEARQCTMPWVRNLPKRIFEFLQLQVI